MEIMGAVKILFVAGLHYAKSRAIPLPTSSVQLEEFS